MKQSPRLHITSICRIMLFTVNPVLSNKCKDMKGFFFFKRSSAVLMASICAVGNPLLSPQNASSSPSPPPPCAPSTDRSITFFFLLFPLCFGCSASVFTPPPAGAGHSHPRVFILLGIIFLLPLAHLRRVTRFSEFRVLKLSPQSLDPRKRSATVGPSGRGVGCKSAAGCSCCTSASDSSVTGTQNE